MARARFDYSSRGSVNHWTKTVTSIYPSFKNESVLPWENRKPITIVTFNEIIAKENSNQMGPITLRKSSSALSIFQLEEILKHNMNATNINLHVTDIGAKDGQTISLDLSKLESGEAVDFTRMVSSNTNIGFDSNPHMPNSLYLPSRPDDVTPLKVNQNVTSAISAVNTEVFRPDLIANKSKPLVATTTNPMLELNSDKKSENFRTKITVNKTIEINNKAKSNQENLSTARRPSLNNEKASPDSNVLKKVSKFFMGR